MGRNSGTSGSARTGSRPPGGRSWAWRASWGDPGRIRGAQRPQEPRSPRPEGSSMGPGPRPSEGLWGPSFPGSLPAAGPGDCGIPGFHRGKAYYCSSSSLLVYWGSGRAS